MLRWKRGVVVGVRKILTVSLYSFAIGCSRLSNRHHPQKLFTQNTERMNFNPSIQGSFPKRYAPLAGSIKGTDPRNLIVLSSWRGPGIRQLSKPLETVGNPLPPRRSRPWKYTAASGWIPLSECIDVYNYSKSEQSLS